MPRTKAFDVNTVLASAQDLFWKKGYAATSIGDLEKHTGISRSSLYQTFGGKRQLYDRTLAVYQEDNQQRLRSALLNVTNLRQALTDLFYGAAAQHVADCVSSARGCYIIAATTELAPTCTDAFRFVADNRQKFVSILQDALARAQEQGELLKEANVGDLANYLFICYNGLQVVVQTDIDRKALARAVQVGVDALPWA